MSGEGVLPCNGLVMPIGLTELGTPARIADLRDLVEQLQLMSASGTCDRAVARKAANELAGVADALEKGGGLVSGFVVVPLLDAAVLPAPVPPPPLPPPGGGGIAAEGQPA